MSRKPGRNKDKKPVYSLDDISPPPGKRGLDQGYLARLWWGILSCLWIPVVVGLILYFLFGP